MRNFLICGLAAVLVAFSPDAHPQGGASAEEQADRHLGIGIALTRVGWDWTEFMGPHGRPIQNHGSRYSGLLLVARVLESSPADQAGLRFCDVIAEVEGNAPEHVGIDPILATLRFGEPGKPVRLTLRRFDEDGGLGAPFEVSVPRAYLRGWW